MQKFKIIGKTPSAKKVRGREERKEKKLFSCQYVRIHSVRTKNAWQETQAMFPHTCNSPAVLLRFHRPGNPEEWVFPT